MSCLLPFCVYFVYDFYTNNNNNKLQSLTTLISDSFRWWLAKGYNVCCVLQRLYVCDWSLVLASVNMLLSRSRALGRVFQTVTMSTCVSFCLAELAEHVPFGRIFLCDFTNPFILKRFVILFYYCKLMYILAELADVIYSSYYILFRMAINHCACTTELQINWNKCIFFCFWHLQIFVYF